MYSLKKAFVCIVALILCLSACKSDYKYDIWKDTVCAYGDGTYQILHQSIDGDDGEELQNCKYNQCVLTEIDSYEETDDCVYFIGKYYSQDIWCKLYVDDNLLIYYVKDNGDEFIMTYLSEMQEDNQIKILSKYEEFSEDDMGFFETLTELEAES